MIRENHRGILLKMILSASQILELILADQQPKLYIGQVQWQQFVHCQPICTVTFSFIQFVHSQTIVQCHASQFYLAC